MKYEDLDIIYKYLKELYRVCSKYHTPKLEDKVYNQLVNIRDMANKIIEEDWFK